MSNKLPTAWETTRELIDAFSDAIGSDISVSPKSRHDISAIIESHTQAHTKELRERISDIVKAWESLPEGNYDKSVIQNWIVNDMFPSIMKAREALK